MNGAVQSSLLQRQEGDDKNGPVTAASLPGYTTTAAKKKEGYKGNSNGTSRINTMTVS
ncbi:hypothetical protein PISMIDRAFT_689951, partial [Pisolithus microcarpus 441]